MVLNHMQNGHCWNPKSWHSIAHPCTPKLLWTAGLDTEGMDFSNTAQESCRTLAVVRLPMMMLRETCKEGNTSRSNGSFPSSLLGQVCWQARERRRAIKLFFDLRYFFSLLLCLPANHTTPVLPLMCANILSMAYTVIHWGGSRQ